MGQRMATGGSGRNTRSPVHKRFGRPVTKDFAELDKHNFREILATLSSQGTAPAGPLFDHHLKTSEQVFDFEVGFPIVSPMQPTGRVKNGELPGGRIARAVMRGNYEGLAGAWAEFHEWMKSEGHMSRGDFWQIFTAGPESSPDPATWRTDLCLPLKPSD